MSVSAHILSTTQPLILSKDTDSIRAHILAGANRKRWPAHMDMHEDTAPPHAAVSTCPICNAEQTDREGLGSRARLCFATPHARPQQPTRILVLSDAMNGGHVPY